MIICGAAIILLLSLVDYGLISTSHSQQAQEAMKNLPPEQQEQAKGVMANAQAGAGALAGTAGGAVKGVVDTAGNTVCTQHLICLRAPHTHMALTKFIRMLKGIRLAL